MNTRVFALAALAAFLLPTTASSASGDLSDELVWDVLFCAVEPDLEDGTPGGVACADHAVPLRSAGGTDLPAFPDDPCGMGLLCLDNGDGGSTTWTTLGVQWEHTQYRGQYLVWSTSAPGACYNYSFTINAMPSGWNDRVSSAKANPNAGCWMRNYEHELKGGTYLLCATTCYDMAASGFNDRTSSVYFY